VAVSRDCAEIGVVAATMLRPSAVAIYPAAIPSLGLCFKTFQIAPKDFSPGWP
jgi:hypothetical protein